MKIDFQELLPEGFDDRSRVWVYQANRRFSISEAFQIEDILKNFISSWNSHGTPVKGYANLFFGQFVVLIADETGYGVSGCSTDSSVRVIREIEKMFGVNMFDRLLLAFIVKDKLEMIPVTQLPYALDNGFLNNESLYFDNTVQTLADLRSNWITPVGKSWLSRDKRFAEKLTAR